MPIIKIFNTFYEICCIIINVKIYFFLFDLFLDLLLIIFNCLDLHNKFRFINLIRISQIIIFNR
jgi:hypothetical protein